MKQTVNFTGFCDAFSETYRNNFSYEAKRALFDYLEEMEEATGTETELDVVALCCDYNELTYDQVIGEYAVDIDPELEESERRQAVIEYLQENTTVVAELDNTVVFAAF